MKLKNVIKMSSSEIKLVSGGELIGIGVYDSGAQFVSALQTSIDQLNNISKELGEEGIARIHNCLMSAEEGVHDSKKLFDDCYNKVKIEMQAGK